MDITLSLNFILAQIIGFVSLSLGLYAFLNKKDTALKSFMTLQSFALALHYFFLGAVTASTMSTISGIRNFASIFKNLKKAAPIFFFSYVLFGYYTYETPLDLLTPVASCISTIAYFYTEGLFMRVLLLVVSFLWLLNNIFIFSIGPALMEMILVSANMFTIYRMIADEQNKSKHHDP